MQEAEDGLIEQNKNRKVATPRLAILEYTHAINAINYLASISMGSKLILRAHDILLIAHAYRAELEGKSYLMKKIAKAYPRGSEKQTKER